MLQVCCAVMLSASGLAGTQPVWEAGPALPANVTERTHPVALNRNGTLYAIGGPPWNNGGDEDGSVHILGVGASAWTTGAALDGVGPFVFQGGGVDG
ncbi:MAG: hypothetical protein KDA21_10810, partial [Phycisphaerales bacterium]|nr:hypothetical protein [Phycisphaerales bacterium]